MKPRRVLGLVLALVIGGLLPGCAVTSGSTFASVAVAVASGSDNRAPDDAVPDDSAPDEPKPPLRVVTAPEDAEVYLDGRRRGTTPLDVTDLEPGTHVLTVQKDGYYDVRRRIEIPASGTLVVEIDLEQITGFLDVSVWPRDADVFVGGTRLDGGFAELPVGVHTVRVELFGYRGTEEEVRVREQSVSRLNVELERAPFELDALSTWRRRFNPANPGLVGTTLLSYRVTAAGSGRVEVRDSSGVVVRSEPQGPYTTWGQEFRWDGTDGTGRIVPDGAYQMVVTATGDDGRYETAATAVDVDSSLLVRYRSVWTATPGLLYAPTGSALPAGQAQVSSQVAGVVSPFEGSLAARFPGRIGLRVGLGAGLELFAYGGAILHTAPLDNTFAVGGALLWDGPTFAVGPSELGVGAAAGGVYRTPRADGRFAGPDTQANYPGLFVSVPLTLRVRRVALSVAPEYRRTADRIVYGDAALPEDTNAPGNIAYLRGGLVADLGHLTIGASAALRSGRFDEGFAVDLPFQSGVEAHWIVPGSSVAVSGYLAAEIDSRTDFYIMSGLGIGVLF